MANYATLSDWLARMNVTGTEISGSLVPTEAMLVRAEGLVNAFLAKRYTIPIVTDASNGLLQEMTLAIADYEMYKRGMASDVPDKYKYSYDKAMELLLKIASGELAPFPDTTDDKLTSIDITTDDPVMDFDSLNRHF
jgi:phage gp36-like protein